MTKPTTVLTAITWRKKLVIIYIWNIKTKQKWRLYLHLEAKTKDKTIELDRLRCRGDFYHNIKILKTGGEVIVWRRPNIDDVVNVEDYIPCKFCLAFITKSEMWRDVKTCWMKKWESIEFVEHSNQTLYSNRYASGASHELRIILHSMIKDDISKIVHNDSIIYTYGSFMLASSGIKRANGIPQRMRVLTRLLIKLREKYNEEHDFTHFIKP